MKVMKMLTSTRSVAKATFSRLLFWLRQKLCDSRNMNCNFLFLTSNMIERYFSSTGYVLSDLLQYDCGKPRTTTFTESELVPECENQ